jgi:hypothetical protein
MEEETEIKIKEREFKEEPGYALTKKIWKEKPANGKVISLEKAMLNFDCFEGTVKYFPGVMMKIKQNGHIIDAGIPGFVEDYEGFIGRKVDYDYTKIELVPHKTTAYMHAWQYSLRTTDNPENELKKIGSVAL